MTSHAAATQARRAKKRDHPVVVTANRLSDGVVIYLTYSQDWTESLGKARLIQPDEDLDPFVAEGEKAAAERLLVDPYPMPVDTAVGTITPLSVREVIRAAGPTVRLDLGKQAEE